MITTLVLYIFVMLMATLTTLLPEWQVWPSSVITGFEYFLNAIGKLNFILPIDTLFSVLLVVITFETAYFTAKIIVKIINFFRGVGKGLDI